MSNNEHPFKLIRIDNHEAKIDKELVPLIKALNRVGWKTSMSCQNNGDDRVWIQFKKACYAEKFLFCISANSVYDNNELACCVLNATTEMYDKSPYIWEWPNRWWVDSNIDTRLWQHGIEIRISVRFPRAHLKEVTKIMKDVARRKTNEP